MVSGVSQAVQKHQRETGPFECVNEDESDFFLSFQGVSESLYRLGASGDLRESQQFSESFLGHFKALQAVFRGIQLP